MNCVASVYRNNSKKYYNICMLSTTQHNGKVTGYYSTEDSSEILETIKKQMLLNHFEHSGERTSHLLFQPCEPTKEILAHFMNSQYCIGIARGLRDHKNSNMFFEEETKYVDASAKSINTGKTILTLVPEMNLSHALNASQVVKVLKCIVNKAGVNIEDILVFNLTAGNFWCVAGL